MNSAHISQLEFRVDRLSPNDVERSDRDPPRRPVARVATWVAAAAAVVFSGNVYHAIDLMQQTGVALPHALMAVDVARSTNANRLYIAREGVDKANAMKAALAADAPVASEVTAIRFTVVGGATSAIISPQVAGVTVQYTVSGTDGYYDSRALQTDGSGVVLFAIPAARQDVRDTISVTAVLSERTAGTAFVWTAGASTPSVPFAGSASTGPATSATFFTPGGAGLRTQGAPQNNPTAGAVGAPNCDCMGVDAGLLTGPYRDQCNGREQELIGLAVKGALQLQIGPQQTLVAGEFCDPVASGPRAWPAQGAPATPPSGVPRYQPCQPTGLVQRCDP